MSRHICHELDLPYKTTTHKFRIENGARRCILKAKDGFNRHLTASSLLVLLLVSCGSALGQLRTRNLSGTVTDRQHEPLKGAIVEVENDVTMGVISYITSRDGRYSFKRLDGETDYRLWVTFRGRKSKVRKLSQFDSNRPKVMDFVLNLR